MANLVLRRPQPSRFTRLLFALVLRARVNAPGADRPS